MEEKEDRQRGHGEERIQTYQAPVQVPAYNTAEDPVHQQQQRQRGGPCAEYGLPPPPPTPAPP